MYREQGPSDVDWYLMACHEAGHAIVATALGLEVDLVTLEPVEGGVAGCRISEHPITLMEIALQREHPSDIAKQLWDAAIYKIGGIAAENTIAWDSGQGRQDDEESVRLSYSCLGLAGVQTPSFEDFRAEVLRQALEKLQQKARALDPIAKELCRQRSLTGERVREIIAEVAAKETADQ